MTSNTAGNKLYIADFRGIMFEKIVPLTDLSDHTGKPLGNIVAYWRRHGLLPFIEEGKWAKLSFMQLIWLRILDDLRQIGFPLTKMLMLCDYLFKDAYKNQLPEVNLRYNKEIIVKKLKAGTNTEDDDLLLAQIENTLKYPKALQILKFDVNYLSTMVANSISNNKEGIIYIFFDGRVWEFLGNDYIGHNKNDIDRYEPHICINITHYLREFINNEELSGLFMPQILNEDELKVLSEMRRKNVKQITIYKDNNLMPRIESTRTGKLTAEQTSEIKKVLGFKNYEQIILDTIDEKTLSFKRIKKKL